MRGRGVAVFLAAVFMFVLASPAASASTSKPWPASQTSKVIDGTVANSLDAQGSTSTAYVRATYAPIAYPNVPDNLGTGAVSTTAPVDVYGWVPTYGWLPIYTTEPVYGWIPTYGQQAVYGWVSVPTVVYSWVEVAHYHDSSQNVNCSGVRQIPDGYNPTYNRLGPLTPFGACYNNGNYPGSTAKNMEYQQYNTGNYYYAGSGGSPVSTGSTTFSNLRTWCDEFYPTWYSAGVHGPAGWYYDCRNYQTYSDYWQYNPHTEYTQMWEFLYYQTVQTGQYWGQTGTTQVQTGQYWGQTGTSWQKTGTQNVTTWTSTHWGYTVNLSCSSNGSSVPLGSYTAPEQNLPPAQLTLAINQPGDTSYVQADGVTKLVANPKLSSQVSACPYSPVLRPT